MTAYTLYYIIFMLIPVGLFWIVKRIFASKLSWKSFLPFIFSVSFLLILANILWKKYVFNKIYFNWDPDDIPVKLLFHDSAWAWPTNWLAVGWTHLYLDLLFYLILVGIYLISYGFSLFWLKGKKIGKPYHKTIIISVVLLMTIAIVLNSWIRNDDGGAFNSKIAIYKSQDCANLENSNDYQSNCLIDVHSVGIVKDVAGLNNYTPYQFRDSPNVKLQLNSDSWDCAVDGKIITDWSHEKIAENKTYKCFPK